jgi:uracil-DNA glycosylase family 4
MLAILLPMSGTGEQQTAAEIARSLRMTLAGAADAGIAYATVDVALVRGTNAAAAGTAKPQTRQVATPTPASPPARPFAQPAPAAAKQPERKPVMRPSIAGTALEAMPGERAKALAALAHDVAKCAECRLCETRTQTVFSRGNPNSPLMLIGEAPGADEDEQGLPFVGRAGQLLNDILTKGMKYDPADVYVANVLKCRPPNNRNPEPDEIEKCRGYLSRQIEIIQPLVILALGRFPAQWLLDSQETIGKLRGRIWDVKGRKVVCTYHPAYLLRNPAAKVEVWKDVQMVMDFFGRDKPLPMRA